MKSLTIRLALPLLIAAPLAACGSDSDPAPPTGSDATPVSIKIGATQAVSNIALKLGIDQGFFADEGLDVELVWAQGGAAVVPAVLSGEQQFGESNVVSLLLASEKQLPIDIIGSAASGATDPEADSVGILVPGDSAIEELDDLRGKTIAVNALSSVAEVTAKASLEKAGVPASEVKFTEVPFPEMGMALEKGQVDAVWQTEPFLTPLLSNGARMIAGPFTDLQPGMQFGLVFSSKEYAEKNPEVVSSFQAGLAKALAYANENTDVVRQVAAEQFKVDPAIAEEMRLPSWNAEINLESVERIATLMSEFGMLKEEADLSNFK